MLVDQFGCFGLSGDQAAIEKLVHHPETKNPACLSGEQGSRKVDDLWSDLELPACLLGKVFVRGTRPRIGCLDAEPETGFSNAQEHTRATQPCGRLRMLWIYS